MRPAAGGGRMTDAREQVVSTLDPSAGKTILTADEMRRAISRIAHEILERNDGAGDLVLAGMRQRGLVLAQRLAAKITDLEQVPVPVCQIETARYRDDLRERARPLTPEPLGVEITERVAVLVDDVFFTGRTARAAMDALLDRGRPRKIQLAVLVDRGHRELPIRPDYVGKNVPTARAESIRVQLAEIDGADAVRLRRPDPAPTAGERKERAGDE